MIRMIWVTVGESRIQDCASKACGQSWILDPSPNQNDSEMIRVPGAPPPIEYMLNPLEYGLLRFDHFILYFEPVVLRTVFFCAL